MTDPGSPFPAAKGTGGRRSVLFSSAGLPISNLIVFWLALRDGWELREIAALYWFQNVLIGSFYFLRLLLLRRFDPSGLLVNRRPIDESGNSQFMVAFFFLVHYGLFHLAYLAFLSERSTARTPVSPGILLGCAACFLFHHLQVFLRQHSADLRSRPNLGRIMFAPYARVVPMHLALFAGFTFSSGENRLMVGMGLKILADLLMHFFEIRSSSPAKASGSEAVPESESPAMPAAKGWCAFGVALALTAAVLLSWVCPKTVRWLWQASAQRWVAVPCTILIPVEAPLENRGESSPPILFEYSFEDQTYTSSEPSPWLNSRPKSRVFSTETPDENPDSLAGPALCYVNPRNPEYAVLAPYPAAAQVVGAAAVTLLPVLILAAGMIALLSCRKLKI